MERSDRLSLFARISVCLLGAGIFLWLSVKYLLPVILPFLIGYLIALLAKPLAAKLAGGRRFERPLRALLAAVIVAVLLVALFSLVWGLLNKALSVLSSLAGSETVGTLLDGMRSPLRKSPIPEELREQIGEAIRSLLSSALTSVGKTAASLASRLPGALLFLLATAIAAVWFSLDLEKFHRALGAILPQRVCASLCAFRERGASVALGYLRAYGLLGLITFSIVLAGLLLLRVEQAALLAVLITLLDALPVIGVGTLIVPWAVYSFLTGKSALGVGLLVLYAVNLTVRQICEPKILGKNLGLHPLFTFFLLYAGVSLFGALGLLAVPAAAVLSEGLFAVLRKGARGEGKEGREGREEKKEKSG